MPIQRSYKDYPDPKLYSYEILIKVKELNIPQFTSSEVADMFGICRAEACTRINVLKRYNLIKRVDPDVYPAVYEMTKWGHKYIDKKIKEDYEPE